MPVIRPTSAELTEPVDVGPPVYPNRPRCVQWQSLVPRLKSFQSTVRLSTFVTVPELMGWTHDYSDSVRPSGARPLSELSRPVAPTPAFTSDRPTHNVLFESSGYVAPTLALLLSCPMSHRLSGLTMLVATAPALSPFCLNSTMLSELSKPVATTPASLSSRLSRSSLPRSSTLGIIIAVTSVKSLLRVLRPKPDPGLGLTVRGWDEETISQTQ